MTIQMSKNDRTEFMLMLCCMICMIICIMYCYVAQYHCIMFPTKYILGCYFASSKKASTNSWQNLTWRNTFSSKITKKKKTFHYVSKTRGNDYSCLLYYFTSVTLLVYVIYLSIFTFYMCGNEVRTCFIMYIYTYVYLFKCTYTEHIRLRKIALFHAFEYHFHAHFQLWSTL